MKTGAMLAILAAIGGSASARQVRERDGRTVAVYINNDVVAMDALKKAKASASAIFATADVRLEWHDYKAENGSLPPGAISIGFNSKTPQSIMPGALAFARPYEGVHITIFYDRIQGATASERTPIVLAHVIAHEITHLLQGIDRHSETGVMKANWSARDYSDMTVLALRFTQEDVDLIQAGVEARVRARSTTAVLIQSGR